MTERKFKVGDKVRVVKSRTRHSERYVGQEGEVNYVSGLRTATYPYSVTGFPTLSSLDFDEEELELATVAPKAGDRVNVTVKNYPVYEDGFGELYVSHWSQRLYLRGLDVKVITPPIVLPTGKNALVEIKDYRYVRTHDDAWFSLTGRATVEDGVMLKSANRHPDTYRVIFEGEE